MIRVLIVDDNASVRAMISRLFDRSRDMVVVGQCCDGADSAAAAAAVEPDVVLMDLNMPNLSGLEAARILSVQQPAAKVIMWTAAPPTSRGLADAETAGAVGYLVKNGNLAKLFTAVRTVASGGTAWPHDAEPRRLTGS